MRGLEVYNNTHAVIRVVKADGSEVPLLDAGSKTGRTKNYTNFILQSVQEARMEKHQIIETFGEPYVYFFGEQPRFLDCQSVLVSSNDFNWVAEFWENYDRYLRGTRCAEIGARILLFYDDVIVGGYMVMAQAVKNSQQPLEVPLTFRLFVTDHKNISVIGDPRFPQREGIDQTAEENTLSILSQDGSKLGFQANQKLFGLVADNVDEWTGPQEDTTPPAAGNDPIGRPHPDPLPLAFIREAAKLGVDVDNAEMLKVLNLLEDEFRPAKKGHFGLISAPPKTNA
jgi:hypothetical protein